MTAPDPACLGDLFPDVVDLLAELVAARRVDDRRTPDNPTTEG